MKSRDLITLVATGAILTAPSLETPWAASPVPFPEAEVRFEQNATDEDVEVIFAIGGGTEGFAKIVVRGPDGRTAVDFSAPDGTTLGIRTFTFESPEPRDVAALKAAYPAGTWTFEGVSASGIQFHSTAELTHVLPPTVSFVQPAEEAEDVEPGELEITWTPAADVVAYLVEIEQEELNVSVQARVSSTQASFVVPSGFLQPDTEYSLSIGTVSDVGNISFVETSFVTRGD